MKNKIPFRQRVGQFMAYRNGADALGFALVCFGILFSVIRFFIPGDVWILPALQALLLFYFVFRFFSKNKEKRARENRAFLSALYAVRNFFRRQKNRFTDRKTHIYRKCPHCKKTLRLPRLVGEHTAVCPVCSHRFSVKVKK